MSAPRRFPAVRRPTSPLSRAISRCKSSTLAALDQPLRQQFLARLKILSHQSHLRVLCPKLARDPVDLGLNLHLLLAQLIDLFVQRVAPRLKKRNLPVDLALSPGRV